MMYKITKSWIGIEKKSISATEEESIKLSNEIQWDNDCSGENIASCFDFIRSALNFQKIIGKTETVQLQTEKHQIENGKTKQVIEKPISEVQEIIKEKNEVKQTTITTNKISSSFDW